MALFDRLLHLHRGYRPTEDFFTEVVAHLFGAHASLCVRWLREVGVVGSIDAYAAVRVGTQLALPPLPGHVSGSRPDLVVWLDRPGGEPDLVVVESKVGSGEGAEQLRRYAEHVARMGPARRRALVYATRDADPKRETDALGAVPATGGVAFHAARWSSLHRVLRSYATNNPGDALLTETLHFMESHGMDTPARFTPLDALALTRIRRTLTFMDDVLHGGPAVRFKELMDGMNRSDASLTQLRNHGRYVVFRTLDSGRFEVLLGFFVREGEDLPELGLSIGAYPGGADGASVVRALREVGAGEGWAFRDLRPGTEWVFADRRVPLGALLGEEDHARAASRELNAALDELASVMRAHPALPWRSPDVEE